MLVIVVDHGDHADARVGSRIRGRTLERQDASRAARGKSRAGGAKQRTEPTLAARMRRAGGGRLGWALDRCRLRARRARPPLAGEHVRQARWRRVAGRAARKLGGELRETGAGGLDRQISEHEVVGALAQLAQTAGVVEQLADDFRHLVDARFEVVLAGGQRVAVEAGLGDDDAAVADRLEEAHPLERRRRRSVQVEQDLGLTEARVLLVLNEEVRPWSGAGLERRDQELAVARPELAPIPASSGSRRGSAAPR